MKPSNLLFIMSDEHTREVLGCYGNRIAQTPHLDALAGRGTRFVNAYTNSPICVPARAGFATGRYVHQTRCWDSAQHYHGQIPSWGHRLMERGHRVTSIGKLHYRDTRDSNGFDEEILPLHAHKGLGWVRGLLRKELRDFPETADFAQKIGPGESAYTQFDRKVCGAACDWLRQAGTGSDDDKPWVLFVGFVAPHFPLIAPQRFYDLYAFAPIPRPRQYEMQRHRLNPAVAALRDFYNYNDYFDPQRLKIALASYYGLCSFLDDNIGQILTILKAYGLSQNTRVIYTSDHGECLGNRGMWTKQVMYEESAAIPLIMAGSDIPANRTVNTPVSLADGYPTIIESSGETLIEEDKGLPGRSWIRIANEPDTERIVFSEYHDGGSITGSYMIRIGPWKYIYHVGYSPELYNLDRDPHETQDLAHDPGHADVCRECLAALHRILDPEAVNAMAFEDQRRKIGALGGVEACRQSENWGGFSPISF